MHLPVEINPAAIGLRKVAYPPAEAMDIMSISRAQFYRFVRDGELPIARHGVRTLVLAADLARLLLKMRDVGLPSRPRRPGEPARQATETSPAK
jgi:hypothetical protein